MNCGEICSRTVVFAYPDIPLNDAARLMREEHVGSLVVVEETGQGRVPVGMLTDRDMVVAVMAKEVDTATLTVGEVMSANIATVAEGTGVFDALRLMRSRGIRRLPVTGAAGVLVGILTIDDVLELVSGHLHEVVQAIGNERQRERRGRT